MALNKSSRAPTLSSVNADAPPDAEERLRALEIEAERWREAARRTADEIGGKARAAREAYERRAAEFDHAWLPCAPSSTPPAARSP